MGDCCGKFSKDRNEIKLYYNKYDKRTNLNKDRINQKNKGISLPHIPSQKNEDIKNSKQYVRNINNNHNGYSHSNKYKINNYDYSKNNNINVQNNYYKQNNNLYNLNTKVNKNYNIHFFNDNKKPVIPSPNILHYNNINQYETKPKIQNHFNDTYNNSTNSSTINKNKNIDSYQKRYIINAEKKSNNSNKRIDIYQQNNNNNEDKKSVQSNRSNQSRKSSSIDSKKLKEIKNLGNNNNNNLVQKNENSKKSKHVSVNKYKEKEKIQKSQQKLEIETIENKSLLNSNSSSNKPKGLYNLGLSCYMNSILQCLFYITELRNYFINNRKEFYNKPVCNALSEVMYGLKNETKEYYEPIAFKREMGNKNSLFSGFKAGDAKDLFFNLIDSILNELSKENEDEPTEQDIDFTSKSEVFRITKKEVDKNIINDLFIGYYENSYKCINTSNNIYCFNTDSFILFELEKISNFYDNKILSLDDCFEYNFNRTYKTSFYCSVCKKTENNNARDLIYQPPEILVLILDRGKGKKFKGKVSFEIDLDIKDYMDKEGYNLNSKYKLIGVSTHSGTSSSSGHYTACCLTDNGQYYYFSDTYVNYVDINKLNKDEPYLLFYKQKKLN